MPFQLKSDVALKRAFTRLGLDETLQGKLSALILDSLFPLRCGGCFRLSKEVFCHHCQLYIHPIATPFCACCGVPFDPVAMTNPICAKCRLMPPKYDAARSHQQFEGPMREAIHHLKYRKHFDFARRLAPFLVEVLGRDEKLRDFNPDFLVPVPLHKSRLRTRGFNQSALLAQELSKLSKIPFEETLIRTRKTPQQVGLSAEQRIKNVKGAFEMGTASNREMEGARVLLIDDVFTTGATLSECARVLKKVGAIEVAALTLARQRSPQENEPIPEQWIETII